MLDIDGKRKSGVGKETFRDRVVRTLKETLRKYEEEK